MLLCWLDVDVLNGRYGVGVIVGFALACDIVVVRPVMSAVGLCLAVSAWCFDLVETPNSAPSFVLFCIFVFLCLGDAKLKSCLQP